MTSIGPDNVVFLDFYNKSIQLKGLINIVELDADLFSLEMLSSRIWKGV